MKLTDKVLVDFDQRPMITPDGKTTWTVRVVLINACVQPGDPQQPPRTELEHRRRYLLAQKLHAVKPGEEIDIPVAMVVPLRRDISRLYGTMIAHPMFEALGGYDDLEEEAAGVTH
jgi:antitoxin (DNA-binding transcriptional repressor) of toxin-antitoxin stability system